ncbi:MAG: hypothetical protein O7H39_17360, partial [Gammaproteobacteria bacterium]|nr:hypothetical protein [Gammaproteobacteria bacterium]
MRVVLFALTSPMWMSAQQSGAVGLSEIPDVVFAKVDGLELKLDLYLPTDPSTHPTHPSEPPPLLVWVHGGA